MIGALIFGGFLVVLAVVLFINQRSKRKTAMKQLSEEEQVFRGMKPPGSNEPPLPRPGSKIG